MPTFVSARSALATSLSPETRRDFAVIVPAYNEVANIPDLVVEFQKLFNDYDLSGQIILVDDGSTDGTGSEAQRFASEWENLKVLSHRRNFGKSEAITSAADNTTAKYLVLFDADLQHSVHEVPRYLAKLQEGYDIVTGRKIGKYDKSKVSRLYNWLSRCMFNVPATDLNSMRK